MRAQHLSRGSASLQIKGVYHGETKAAGRHGVALGLLILMKSDLQARDARHSPHLRHERRRRMAIAPPMRTEQHHAVSVTPVRIGEVPSPLVIEAHECLDPAGAVEVRPLIAHAQVHFDDTAADGLGVDDAGIALEMPADPRAAIVLDGTIACGVHRPMVERDGDRKSTRLNSSHVKISYAV